MATASFGVQQWWAMVSSHARNYSSCILGLYFHSTLFPCIAKLASIVLEWSMYLILLLFSFSFSFGLISGYCPLIIDTPDPLSWLCFLLFIFLYYSIFSNILYTIVCYTTQCHAYFLQYLLLSFFYYLVHSFLVLSTYSHSHISLTQCTYTFPYPFSMYFDHALHCGYCINIH